MASERRSIHLSCELRATKNGRSKPQNICNHILKYQNLPKSEHPKKFKDTQNVANKIGPLLKVPIRLHRCRLSLRSLAPAEDAPQAHGDAVEEGGDEEDGAQRRRGVGRTEHGADVKAGRSRRCRKRGEQTSKEASGSCFRQLEYHDFDF